jgi:hypothetical protein
MDNEEKYRISNIAYRIDDLCYDLLHEEIGRGDAIKELEHISKDLIYLTNK